MDAFKKITEGEIDLQQGFESLTKNIPKLRNLWESDPTLLFQNFLKDAMDSVIGSSSTAIAMKVLGASAETVINPWAILLTATITGVEKALLHGTDDRPEEPWKEGNFALIESGFRKEVDRGLEWAEAAFFEDADDDALLHEGEMKYDIAMVESYLEGKGCNVFNLVTRERQFVDEHKMKRPSKELTDNKNLKDLVSAFIFRKPLSGMSDAVKKIVQSVHHFHVGDHVHYKHSDTMLKIVKLIPEEN